MKQQDSTICELIGKLRSALCGVLVCLILLELLSGDAQATDAIFTVSADTDDADEIPSGTVYVTDGSSFFSSTRVGFRFQNVTIPAGATVTSATLETFSNGNGTTSFSVDLTAQDADNPPTFTTTNGNITSRALTSNQTLWSTGSVSYSVGDSIMSPNFASSIQEVVDRGGWSSGNAMVVITTTNSGNKGIFKRSGSPTHAPRLHVTYTTGSTYYVRPDGNDSNAGTGPSAAQAWQTIEHALTSSSVSAGTVVNVMSGTYTEEIAPTRDGASGNPIQVFADRTGAIFGTTGGNVTIQAPSSTSVFDLEFDDHITFTGFRLQGNGTDTVFLSDCNGIIFKDCEVLSGTNGYNIAGSSTVTLINCLIRDNSADGANLNGGTTNFYNCTVVANGGDGIDAGNDTATVINSIVANNVGAGFRRQSDGDGTFSNFYNLLYNNTGGNYSGASAGFGELTSDPQFVGGGDYRLQTGSPAIDSGGDLSGTVDDDIEGISRPQSSDHDMGAYEHVATTIYYVRADGSDSNSGTGPGVSDAFATIDHPASLSALNPGDIVYVQAGTYTEAIYPTIDGTSSLPIQFIADTKGEISGWPAGKVTIQASSGNKAIQPDGDDYLEFHGFTISGSGADDAIDVDNCQGFVLSHCEVYGGVKGIELDHGTSATLINCLVHNNSNKGLHIADATATVWNCTIANNTSDGIEMDAGTATITNCIIANNGDAGFDHNGGTLTHTYNLVYGNIIDFEGTSASTGEISVDPRFVSTSDYHLLESSPAIEVGTSAAGIVDDDLDGLVRPNGATWDMGCYESALAGHYKLDETSGTVAADSSGNGHDGTLVGAPTWSTDAILGGGLEYDYNDGNDYVELPNSTQLDELQLGSYTLTTWYKPASVPPATGNSNLSGHGLIKKPNSSIGLHYSHITGFQFNHYADEGSGPVQQAITASVYDIGEYHHVACVVDQAAGVVEMYVNGVSVGTNTFAPGSPGFDTGTQQWRLGISGPGAPTAERPAHGIQDDVRLYGRALSANEVQSMFAAASGLVAHWKLDETSGTTATDSSLSAYDGTYTSGPTLNQKGPYPGEGAIATDFSGTAGEKVALPTIDVNFSNGLTMAVWYKVDALTGSYTDFFSLSNGSLVDDIWFGLDNSQGLDLFLSDTADGAAWRGLIENSGVPETGAWKHAVAVVDASGNAKLFSNGQVVASGYVGLPRDVARTQNNISETTFGHTLDGHLFDVRLYNRALNDAEVSELYGLVGHWKMDEGSGGTTADSSGYDNDATINGANWIVDCSGRNGLAFDGISDSATTNADFDPPETGAVAVWLRSAGNPGARSRPFGLNGNWEVRQEPDGTLSFDLGGEGPDVGAGGDEFVTSEALSFEDRWYHVIAQFDATDDSFEIYIDGVLVHSGTNGDDMTEQLPGIFSFGTRTGSSENWEGGMRDFRVYNRYLSETEIAQFSGIVARWKLDETGGSLAVDSSPNGHDGTLTGNPTWTTAGQIDGALDFETSDGDDGVDVGTFDVSGSELSIAAWVRPEDGSTDQRIIIKASSTALQSQYWGMAIGASLELDFRLKAGGTTQFFTENNVLSPGKWSHVAGTYDGVTMRMYVNGNLIRSVAHTVGGPLDEDPAVPVTIGTANVSGRAYDGRLDDIRVMSRVMCDEEVRDLYKGGRPAGIRIMKWVEIR